MNYSKTIKSLFLTILFSIFLTSCSKEIETVLFENSSLINVKLKGTPSQFNKLNIELLNVQFRVLEDKTDPNAWVTINPNTIGIHNISEYTNDQTIILCDFEEFPSKYIYEIRLEIGYENSVSMNGVVYPITYQIEDLEGFSNIVKKQLDANKVYEFLIEVDIQKSITFSENDEAYLTPKMYTSLRTFELF